jgi:hypothetical protein
MAEHAMTRPCPSCGARMIRRSSGIALPTDPPQYPWSWWCGCGHAEAGGVERTTTDEEAAMDRWRAAQED